MSPCWVLIVTRGLRVWLPPEIYVHDQHTAIREAARWRSTLRIPLEPGSFSPTTRVLHLIQSVFPDPWRACPVWVGTTWSVRSFPRMKIELMAADEKEAAAWLHRRIPRKLAAGRPDQVVFERREYLASAGVFRVKRVSGV